MNVRTLDTRDPGFQAEFARLVGGHPAGHQSDERPAAAPADRVRGPGGGPRQARPAESLPSFTSAPLRACCWRKSPRCQSSRL